MDKLINCQAVVDKIMNGVKKDVARIAELYGDAPRLAVILVGNDPASEVYVRNKTRRCEQAGIECETIHLPADTTMSMLKSHILGLNKNESVHGILVQMPLPRHIDADEIINTIDPMKDVDGLHPFNQAQLLNNKHPRLEPCTPAGVMKILSEVYGEGPLSGKAITILGRSRLFGQPMAQMAVNADMTVSICHSKTGELDKFVLMQNADVVVSAIGKPKELNADDFTEFTTIIDVGINRDENGKLCGDVDTQDILDTLDRVQITPVPGGVGIVTTAMLMENVVHAYCIQNQIYAGK